MFIINLISTLFGIIICYRFFDCFLKRKELSRKYIFFTYGFLTLVTMFMNLTVINNIVNLMLSLMTIIIISLLFKDTLPNKLLVCSLYAIFSILLETSIWFFINIIFNLDDIIIDEYNFFVYFGLIIFNLIRFILTSYLKKHRERNLFLGSKYISINILIVPLLSIIILFVFVNQEVKNLENTNFGFCYFLVLSITIINIFLFHILEKTEKLYEEKIEIAAAMEKVKYREVYYSELEKHQEEIRIIKHDLKNQLYVISSYINDQDYKKAKEILRLLSVDISQNEKKNFTLNMVVNSILNSKISVMQENSITYNFKINIPPNLGIDDKDIVTLIGNILDNAIEAELKIDGERYISLNIQYFNNSIIIICENKVDKKVVSLKSLKPDTLYHGLGLKSIDKIAQKYSGSKRIISTENVFRIEVNLWSTI